MAWDPVRKWIHRRPLMLFAACLTAGMAIGYQDAAAWYVWAIILLMTAAVGLLRRRSVFLFASALPLGAVIAALALIKPAVIEQDDILLQGRIASEPAIREEYTRVILEHASSDGNELSSRVMLYLYGEGLPALDYGAEISVPADTYFPSDRANPYSDSYTAYLWQQGIALCASASSKNLSITAPPEFSIAGWSIHCRLCLQEIVDSIYSEDIAPLVSALVLGDRSMLPDELYENFKIAGLAHLLAISGLHISCLAFMLDFLLRKLRIPDKVSVILVTLFLIVYASVIGFPASICRAVLMYLLSAGARLAGRPSDGLTGLSAALIILLLINPLSIADVSLILSFSSVAGLMIFTRLLTPRSSFRLPAGVRWIIGLLTASLSAQLGSMPVIACVFGSLSTYSLLSNLPALPLMTISLPLAVLSVLFGLGSPLIGRLIALPVGWLLKGLMLFTNTIAALPGAVVHTPLWPAVLVLVYIAVCLLCAPVSFIRRRFKQILIGLLPLLACSALLLPITYPTSGLEVLFLDAGQADAAVIRAEEVYYLMDVGEDSTMADHLADTGVRPAGIFLSHPHSDHAGGLKEIIELCPPGVIYIPCLWNEVEADEGVPELLSAAIDADWIIHPLKAGDTLRLSDHVSARVCQPFPGMTDDANSASLCLSVSIGQGSVLFTGDLPIEDEHAYFPDCDVLKIPHHGAKGSSSSLLLQMTSPSAAVISVGHNSYGHPSDETLARLNAIGAEVYRTDMHGAVSALLGPDGLIEITPIKPH